MLARVTFILAVLVTLLTGYMTAEPHFSDWSAPVNLGAVVNSAFNDQAPAVSKDGLSLYFSSNRPGFGAMDLWVSQRESTDQDWGPPVNLGPVINTTANEWRPSLSRDEHWLIFSSSRVGRLSGLDIWASYREHVHDDLGWQTPVNLGAAINSPGGQNNASYIENDDTGIPQVYFVSNGSDPGFGAFNILVSELLPSGVWGAPALVPELSTNLLAEIHVSVSFDGLEVFFARGIPPGGFDLWTSTRKTVQDSWSEPVNLGPLVNSATIDEGPHIAPDRHTLYFDSWRTGGFGGSDLWMTTRTKATE